MKTITYNNINSNLNFDNVSLTLSKFWMNEIKKNNSKIWLSITIYNKRNKAFTIIKNLPFNTNSYTDVLIVLKQVFNSNALPNKKIIISNMVFSFLLVNKNNWKEYNIGIILLILYAILLISGTFILFYTASVLLDVVETSNNALLINSDILLSDTMEENAYKYSNKCIFNVFSDLFDKSSYRYYPSYFIGSNKNLINENNNIPLLNYIISKQFYILNNAVQNFSEYFGKNELLKYDLNSIVTEYSYYSKYCITSNLQ